MISISLPAFDTSVGTYARPTPTSRDGLTVPLVTSNKLKGIAVTTKSRSAALPNVPTAAESGYPGITSTVWTAFFVPAKTPQPVAKKLGDAVL